MSSSIETEDIKNKSETRLNYCVRAFQCSKQESFHFSNATADDISICFC